MDAAESPAAKCKFAVSGSFAGDAQADAAVAALGERGLHSTREVLGANAHGTVQTLTRSRPPLLWQAIWLGFWWSVAGAIVGALVGLVFGVLGVSAPAIGTSIALEVASWAMFLHIGGALLGLYLALTSAAPGADESSAPPSDVVRVRVTSNDRSDTDAAQRILWEQGASSVAQEHAEGQNQTWRRVQPGR